VRQLYVESQLIVHFTVNVLVAMQTFFKRYFYVGSLYQVVYFYKISRRTLKLSQNCLYTDCHPQSSSYVWK